MAKDLKDIKGKYYTVSKRFIDSLGFDHLDLDILTKDKWLRTKRYKEYKKAFKIKKMIEKNKELNNEEVQKDSNSKVEKILNKSKEINKRENKTITGSNPDEIIIYPDNKNRNSDKELDQNASAFYSRKL